MIATQFQHLPDFYYSPRLILTPKIGIKHNPSKPLRSQTDKDLIDKAKPQLFKPKSRKIAFQPSGFRDFFSFFQTTNG